MQDGCSPRAGIRLRYDFVSQGGICVMKSPSIGLSHELTGISCSDQQRNSGFAPPGLVLVGKGTKCKKAGAAFV